MGDLGVPERYVGAPGEDFHRTEIFPDVVEDGLPSIFRDFARRRRSRRPGNHLQTRHLEGNPLGHNDPLLGEAGGDPRGFPFDDLRPLREAGKTRGRFRIFVGKDPARLVCGGVSAGAGDPGFSSPTRGKEANLRRTPPARVRDTAPPREGDRIRL